MKKLILFAILFFSSIAVTATEYRKLNGNPTPQFLAEVRKIYKNSFELIDLEKIKMSRIRDNQACDRRNYQFSDSRMSLDALFEYESGIAAFVKLKEPKLFFLVTDLNKDLGVPQEIAKKLLDRAKKEEELCLTEKEKIDSIQQIKMLKENFK